MKKHLTLYEHLNGKVKKFETNLDLMVNATIA